MIKISTPLATALAAALKAEIDGFYLHIFSGTVPADAEAATAGATKLVTITVNGDGTTGLTWEVPTSGTLLKETTETWEEIAIASGTASFFRFCDPSDAGTASGPSTTRYQGLCGTDPFTCELVMGTTTITSGVNVPIANFSLNVPEGS